MAVFAYGRVSTKDQSAENQRLEIERAGYAVDYWYADEGISGKVSASQRPQFAKMLGQIRDGETLVVSKLDRLGRDALDVGTTIKMLAARRIEVIVLQLGKLDLTSTAGKMMLTMLSAVAEMERDLLVERTQAGLARAKKIGKTLGRPSTTTLEQRADIIARHQAGASISELSRLHGVSRATIMRIAKPESAQA
ncbi:recombinase family protein [Noviherbaspirillum pedocola]|uniref:Recombinase family protein n=1 Tax=Noviherbaspirillum pedocola TaxID=2801341 RepID=A0A934T0M4_9BURK|nr:recombinase family protein [Noviherbaspirillum pedocola]MBK4739204.1 recombinase family protein [Noviherbaspirillum pedocola]